MNNAKNFVLSLIFTWLHVDAVLCVLGFLSGYSMWLGSGMDLANTMMFFSLMLVFTYIGAKTSQYYSRMLKQELSF